MFIWIQNLSLCMIFYVFFSLNWSKEVSVFIVIKIVVLYENPVYTENETKNWTLFLIANPNQNQ